MIAGWATDRPDKRHYWLVSQAIRLAAAHRLGCITQDTQETATSALAARYRQLLFADGYAKQAEGRTEIIDALDWGIEQVQTKTEAQAKAELGGHDHISAPPPGATQQAPHDRFVKLSTVERQRVSWLWRNYIPARRLSIIEGHPGEIEVRPVRRPCCPGNDGPANADGTFGAGAPTSSSCRPRTTRLTHPPPSGGGRG